MGNEDEENRERAGPILKKSLESAKMEAMKTFYDEPNSLHSLGSACMILIELEIHDAGPRTRRQEAVLQEHKIAEK